MASQKSLSPTTDPILQPTHFQNSPKNGASPALQVALTTRRITVTWKELSRLQKTWRELRSTLPLAPEKLPNLEHLQKTERAYKLQQAENYKKKRHRSLVLPELNPGDKVWIPDKNSPAVVIQKSPQPRSYVVKTEQSLLRRNRRHLITNPKEIKETAKPLPVGNIQPTKETGSTQGINTPCSVVKTRSSRTVIPPTRLDL